jgi:murein DD-endopeptidase MepM/ murein hydrolase activator NlpD
MLRALLAASVTFVALAAPARAATELSSVFASVARTAASLDVRPAEPIDWFPVRGVVDFGGADASFGAWRGGRRHEGQDVFADAGTSLVAMRAGTVVEKGDGGGRGNYIALWSRAAHMTYVYLHMRSPSRLRVGQDVEAGQRVGAVGCSGSCRGDHVHFEMRLGRGTGARAIDPLPELRHLAGRAR